MHSLSCRPQSWRVSSRQGGGSHPAPPRRAGPLQTHPNVRTRRYISRFTRSHDAPANKDAVLHSGEHFVEDGQTDRRVTGLEDTIVQGSDPQSKIMEIVQEQGSPRTDFADGLVSSYELQAEEHQISEAKMEEQTAPHDIGKKYMREIWAFALPALGMGEI